MTNQEYLKILSAPILEAGLVELRTTDEEEKRPAKTGLELWLASGQSWTTLSGWFWLAMIKLNRPVETEVVEALLAQMDEQHRQTYRLAINSFNRGVSENGKAVLDKNP